MRSSRTSKRRVGPQLAIGMVTASVLSVGLAVPAHAAGTNTMTSPGAINIAKASNLILSGTAAPGVTAVTVEFIEGLAAGVLIPATLTLDAVTGTTWSADVSAAVTASPFEGPVEFDATFCAPSCPAPEVIVVVNKDNVAPDVPTAITLVGTDPFATAFTTPTNIQIESLFPDQERTRFTFGTPTAADPTGAALVPAPPLPSHEVAVTEQVKAITFDLAGNPSPIMVANYTVTPVIVTPPAATNTTTTLTVTPANSAVIGTQVALTASVLPAGTAGTFAFFDGATSLASGIIPSPALGAHSYTAKFTPTNPAAFNASTSAATSFTVTSPIVINPPPVVINPPPVVINPPPVVINPPPVVVTNPPVVVVVTAPKVIARSMAVNATGVSQVNNITAKFSMDVTGVNATSFTLRTKAGAAVPAVVTYNSVTRTATLNPARTLLADTNYVATLSSAITAGKALAITRWSFTTGPRPTITARTPGVNARNIARGANVTVKFSERVSGVSGSSLILMTTSGRRVAAVVSYNRITRMATLNPSSGLAAGTTYTAVLGSAIRDAAGNRFAATGWSFTTAGAVRVTGGSFS